MYYNNINSLERCVTFPRILSTKRLTFSYFQLYIREREYEDRRKRERECRRRITGATAGHWSPRYHLHGFRPTSIRHYSSRNARHNLENHAPRRVARGDQRFSARETRPRFGGQPARRRISAPHHRIRIT